MAVGHAALRHPEVMKMGEMSWLGKGRRLFSWQYSDLPTRAVTRVAGPTRVVAVSKPPCPHAASVSDPVNGRATRPDSTSWLWWWPTAPPGGTIVAGRGLSRRVVLARFSPPPDDRVGPVDDLRDPHQGPDEPGPVAAE